MTKPNYDKYIGANLTPHDCELLALAKIPFANLEEESSLFNTKWFAYRRYHPVISTYMYASLYVKAVRNIYAQTKDKDEAEEIIPFEPEDVFQSSELLSFWLARQELDKMCIRYEFALRFAMNRFSNRGWTFFARPNQLYAEDLMIDVKAAWDEECKNSIQIIQTPFFQASNFRGHPDQIEYQKWLCEQVKTRQHPERTISRLLSENVITNKVVQDVFGITILNKAIKMNSV